MFIKISFIFLLYLFEINLKDFYNLRKKSFNLKKILLKLDNKYFYKNDNIIPFDFNNITNNENILVNIYNDELFLSIFAYININNILYKVLIDTGSFNLFFFSKNSNVKNIQFLNCINKYCEKTNKESSLLYGSGFVKGYISKFNFNNFKYKFLLVDYTNFNPNILDFDSLLGIGPSKSYRFNEKSFPEYLNKEFIIFDLNLNNKKMIFSNRCNFLNNEKNIIKSNSNIFFRTNITFKLNNKKSNKYNFIFDTGTSFLLLPKSLKIFFSFLNSKLCYYDKEENYWCDNSIIFPKFEIVIGNSNYELNPKDYSIFLPEENKFLLFLDFINSTEGILGLTFLKTKRFCHNIKKNEIIFIKNKVNSNYNILWIIIFLFILIINNEFKYFINLKILKFNFN